MLPSLKNKNWKKVKELTEKVNKLLQYIPTDDITELNKLIYAGAKQVSIKIGTPLRNLNRNTKTGLKMRLEGQIMKLQQQVKLVRKLKRRETPQERGKKRQL